MLLRGVSLTHVALVAQLADNRSSCTRLHRGALLLYAPRQYTVLCFAHFVSGTDWLAPWGHCCACCFSVESKCSWWAPAQCVVKGAGFG